MQTDRLALPLLATAQAQKEITHNEALSLLDAAVQAVVVEVAPASIPLTPILGQGWIVGVGATGDWSGQDGALAVWTAGGWRFIAPFEGMEVWSISDGMPVRKTTTGWQVGEIAEHVVKIDGIQVVGAQGSAIPNPGGGTTVDAEARSALIAVLNAMRTHGLIAL